MGVCNEPQESHTSSKSAKGSKSKKPSVDRKKQKFAPIENSDSDSDNYDTNIKKQKP